MAIYSGRGSRASGKRRKAHTRIKAAPRGKRVAKLKPKKKTIAKAAKKKIAAKAVKVTPKKRVRVVAKPKRRAAIPKTKTKPKKRAVVAKPKRRAAVAKPKRRAAVAKPKRRAAVAKPKKRVRAVAKPKRRAAIARPSPKKKVRARVKKVVKRKKPAALPVKKPMKSKSRIKKALRVVERRVDTLAADQQKARGKKPQSRMRRDLRAEKRRIEELRVEQALELAALPGGTPEEQRRSLVDNWTRLKKRWKELFKYAKDTNQTPNTKKPLSPRVDSFENYGEQHRIRINRILEPGIIEDVLYRVDQTYRRMSGEFDLWYSNMDMSGLGEKLFGSGNKMLEIKTGDAPDPDALFFQAEGHDNTGIWNSYRSMRHQLQELLESYADMTRTIVFLHHIKLMNYSQKRTS